MDSSKIYAVFTRISFLANICSQTIKCNNINSVDLLGKVLSLFFLLPRMKYKIVGDVDSPDTIEPRNILTPRRYVFCT